MESVPRAVATGLGLGSLDAWFYRDPVATALGTDFMLYDMRLEKPKIEGAIQFENTESVYKIRAQVPDYGLPDFSGRVFVCVTNREGECTGAPETK